MFEVFGHSHLAHQSVLVPVHPRQLSYVGENVVETVSKLEGFNVSEPILDVGVND